MQGKPGVERTLFALTHLNLVSFATVTLVTMEIRMINAKVCWIRFEASPCSFIFFLMNEQETKIFLH